MRPFFPLQHHGRMFLPPCPHCINFLVHRFFEHLLVQEPQGMHGLVLGRWRNVPFHSQMGQECLDLSFALSEILPAGHVVVFHVPADPGAIGPFGMNRIMMEAQHLPHVVQ